VVEDERELRRADPVRRRAFDDAVLVVEVEAAALAAEDALVGTGRRARA